MRRRTLQTIAAGGIGMVLIAGRGDAGQATASAAGGETVAGLPSAFVGPPPPMSPEVISRDAMGRATVRAVRLAEPLRIDGRLEEHVYATVAPISGFIQSAPHEGAPATEVTEVWLTFDDRNIYLSVRCWETHPDQLVATEMRRDNTTVFAGSDAVGFMFDTFYDRRNGALFTVNAAGGLADGQVTNESVYNANWNPIWDAKVSRFDGGWTLEAVIPFKSLRYQPGTDQVWGFNVRRVNKSKNEESFLTRIPIAKVQQGILQSSLAATVVGLEAPSGARNLELKPYVTATVTTPAASVGADRVRSDVGFDVKYGITQNLTADLTYNTDFAQVEADEQQVNLTRFSLFFPEKREFFLENQGLFDFGAIQANSGAGDSPILFYSRRIGLQDGRPIPIRAGGRLTGRINRYTFGVLNIQTGDESAARVRPTNSSVFRVKRDVLRRSSVGLLFTGRTVSQTGLGSNVAFGADGSFSFFQNLTVNTYWAQTRSDGLNGRDTSHRAHLNYAGDRYGAQLEHLAVGEHFNPEIGFVRRVGVRRSSGQLRFSPRLRNNRFIRRVSWVAGLASIETREGRVESRTRDGDFAIEFHNSDRFALELSNDHEYVPSPFRIASGVVVAAGAYDFSTVRTAFTLGQQRRVSATLAAEHGTFYGGRKTTWSITRGRTTLLTRLTAEPSYTINRVELADGSFTTHLLGSRWTYAMTPRMFASALVQFNSDGNLIASNARLRWEYRPGSELFAVYTEERDTRAAGFPGLLNRSFAVKVNRLLRF